jgi:hypothetical protein
LSLAVVAVVAIMAAVVVLADTEQPQGSQEQSQQITQ